MLTRAKSAIGSYLSFSTAGLLQSVSGRLLHTGEQVECAGWRFEVIDLDGRRIDKVLASSVAETLL